MIRGNSERKVKSYLPIDRCGVGLPWVKAGHGEELIGCPWGWAENEAPPFIEHRRLITGAVIRSVNCADISEIEFKIYNG